jgi:hypothetical protein
MRYLCKDGGLLDAVDAGGDAGVDHHVFVHLAGTRLGRDFHIDARGGADVTAVFIGNALDLLAQLRFLHRFAIEHIGAIGHHADIQHRNRLAIFVTAAEQQAGTDKQGGHQFHQRTKIAGRT